MGVIKQTPQKGSPIVELEITYGGTEAPFGGIDTSAPPAYIDPRCFVDASSFMVVDNKLCLVTLQSYTLPVLFLNLSAPIIIGAGTAQFDTNANGNAALQYNYAIGYTMANVAGPPSGKTYTFYITAWDPSNIAITWDDNISYTFLDSAIPAAAASITLPLVSSGPTVSSGGSGALLNITSLSSTSFFIDQVAAISIVHPGTGYVVGGNGYNIVQGSNSTALLLVDTVDGSGGILTAHILYGADGFGYSTGAATLRVANNPSSVSITTNSSVAGSQTYSPYTISLPSGLTQQQQIIQGLIYAINIGGGGGTAPNPDIFASASADGNSLVLTSTIPGAIGNTFTVIDTTVNPISAGSPPLYYFPVRTITNFTGGVNQITSVAPTTVGPASLTNIGNTLYIANIGPAILEYSGA
jgi:hypothetical protein